MNWTGIETEIFRIMNYSFFIEIFSWVFKPHYELKQPKADYSQNIWEEEKRGYAFVWVFCLGIWLLKDFWVVNT